MGNGAGDLSAGRRRLPHAMHPALRARLLCGHSVPANITMLPQNSKHAFANSMN